MYLRSAALLRDTVPDFGRYPFSIPAIRSLDMLQFTRAVTFFVGENGSGKSTLLEAIAYQCGFNTAGGDRSSLYEVDAAGSALGEHIRLAWMPKLTQGFFLRAESFYHFASHLDALVREGYGVSYERYGGRSLHEQSHGESFLALFMNRFSNRGKAVYLLDEPEAALSPGRQLAFMRIMHQLVAGGRAQFIVATHSPILMGYPEADIYSFDEGGIAKVAYEETEHYQITKGFLDRPDLYLKELLQPEEEEE